MLDCPEKNQASSKNMYTHCENFTFMVFIFIFICYLHTVSRIILFCWHVIQLKPSLFQAVSEQVSRLVQSVRASMSHPDSASAQLGLINASQAFLAVSRAISQCGKCVLHCVGLVPYENVCLCLVS